ncbi:MAG: outer membrane lipoprotein-sorting protein [Treponema sp.]|nr:outer membrane lipoprotein-sorting protein [Treponema sp.]MCL2272960.1 outer membrane lipoprotein-sorting protein [Treponema sp.]
MAVRFFMVTLFVVFIAFILPWAIGAQTPTAAQLLARVDNNEIYKTIEYEGDIIIEHGGRRFVKTMKAWGRGNTHSFIEFTNPEDRGTKYLKRDGRLFVYSPDTEEVMLISGHMLKESMMGSDMSYEDTINNETLANRYDAVISGSEVINGRDCWVLDLSAKKRTESYPSRKLWIDKEYGDLVRYELFALSGVKLKEYAMKKVEIINGQRFPVEGEMRDLMRRDSRTTFVMRNVVLDKPIADSVFSQRNLER